MSRVSIFPFWHPAPAKWCFVTLKRLFFSTVGPFLCYDWISNYVCTVWSYFFQSWKAKKEAWVCLDFFFNIFGKYLRLMHDPWQLQDDSKIRVESALNYEQQDKTTRKWPAYQTAHSCTQTKNNEKLITRPIASVAYTYNPHYNVTYCSPCKSKPLFSWMYLQFPFFWHAIPFVRNQQPRVWWHYG